jgi:cytosine/adenosine deaminase-related metal-dependent hydrolase
MGGFEQSARSIRRDAFRRDAGQGRHRRSFRPSAQQALAAATLSGARALGLDSEIGSLVIGKRPM